jgi:hypothetical protein
MSYRILHCDSGEPVELGGAYDYDIGVVEAEIRERPEQFVLIPDPADYEPHGLMVKGVYVDPDDGLVEISLSDKTRYRLEVVRLQALARHAVEVWRGGPAMHDAEEFEAAMCALSDALPTRPSPLVEFDPDVDPF